MKITLALITLLVFANAAWAGSLTIPNTFAPNTPAVADEVNENFDETKAAVDDNDARIGALSGFNYLVDSTSTVIGSLLGTDARYWFILTTQGFIAKLRSDGFPGFETVYFSGPNCTGTPYILVNNNAGGATGRDSNPVYAKQGYVFTDSLDTDIYYVAKNTGVSVNASYQSRYLTSGCQATSGNFDAIQASLNNPAVTGVPNAGYGPVSLP